MKLTSTQYNNLINEYAQTRFDNVHKLNLRTLEIYDKIPEIKEITDSISAISVACAKAMIKARKNSEPNAEENLKKLKSDIECLRKRKNDLLTSHSYPANYLELEYNCPSCKDTGYIENEQCHCFKNKILRLLYQQSNIEDILKRENFSTFREDIYDDKNTDDLLGSTPYENIVYAKKTAIDFVNNFDNEYTNLYIYGDSGVGKTFLSNCIAKELIDSSHSVIYLSATRLFDMLADETFNKSYSDDKTSNFKLTSYLYDCDLLIIDDLGTELINSFTTSELFTCINERNLNRKSTIISSNLSLMDLEKFYSERIFSRLTTYKMLKIIGDDLRIKISLSSWRNDSLMIN